MNEILDLLTKLQDAQYDDEGERALACEEARAALCSAWEGGTEPYADVGPLTP